MDDITLAIIGFCFVVVVNLVWIAYRLEQLQDVIEKLAYRDMPIEPETDDDDDALPWEPGDYVENLRVNEKDFG